MPSIMIASGERAGQRVDFDQDKVTIGRSESNTFVMDMPSISAEHCAIILRGDRYVVRDLDSTNGTSLNGSPVREARIRHGDIIKVGDVELLFEDESAEADYTQRLDAFSTRKSGRWKVIIAVILVTAVTVTAAWWFVFSLMGS